MAREDEKKKRNELEREGGGGETDLPTQED